MRRGRRRRTQEQDSSLPLIKMCAPEQIFPSQALTANTAEIRAMRWLVSLTCGQPPHHPGDAEGPQPFALSEQQHAC